MPSNPPNVIIPSGSTNPGILPCANGGDECEAAIDVEWSGAVAKGAEIERGASLGRTVDAALELLAEFCALG